MPCDGPLADDHKLSSRHEVGTSTQPTVVTKDYTTLCGAWSLTNLPLATSFPRSTVASAQTRRHRQRIPVALFTDHRNLSSFGKRTSRTQVLRLCFRNRLDQARPPSRPCRWGRTEDHQDRTPSVEVRDGAEGCRRRRHTVTGKGVTCSCESTLTPEQG